MFKTFFKWYGGALLITALAISPLAWPLDDPTKPSSYRSVGKQSDGLRLESILFSKARKVAMINGKVLAEGDVMGSRKIIRISKNSVLVSDNGKKITLKLSRTAIRQEK